MQIIGYWVHFLAYTYLLLMGVSAAISPVFFGFECLPEGPAKQAIRIAMVPVFVIVFLGCPWIAHRAASLRTLEGEGFFEALRDAFSEARVWLSCLPVVGRLFAVRATTRDRFEPPELPPPPAANG